MRSRLKNFVIAYIGLAAGVFKLDSDDFCWSNERNFEIVDAKSAVSSYSGLSVKKLFWSVDIFGITDVSDAVISAALSKEFGDFSYKQIRGKNSVYST